MRKAPNPVNQSPASIVRRSMAIDAALRECEAVMFDLLEKAERGQPLSPPEIDRFRRAQQKARLILCREK